MVNKNLVIVRSGDNSLHEHWLRSANTRNWDLVVNYFGDDSSKYLSPDCIRIDSKGPKWPALCELMENNRNLWENYDYVWFPDDDLLIDGSQLNYYFDICASNDLSVSQPSLTWNSHISHMITAHNPQFFLRYTNFVEIMAPCFKTDIVSPLLTTFSENLSGWGLDHLWPRLVDGKFAIVDAVGMCHTRPVGGPNYKMLQEKLISPHQEMADMLRKYNITECEQITLGGLTIDGRQLSLLMETYSEFIEKLVLGYQPLLHTPELVSDFYAIHMQGRSERL